MTFQGRERYLSTGRAIRAVTPDGLHALFSHVHMDREQRPGNWGLREIALSQRDLRRAKALNARLLIAPDTNKVLFLDGYESGLLRLGDGGWLAVPIRNSWPGRFTDASWAPDSRRFAFSTNGRMWIHNIENNTTVLLADGHDPAWSPDGTYIVFRTSDGEAQLLTPDGQKRHRLMAGVRVQGGFRWSPGGGYLAYSRAYPLTYPLGPVGYTGVYRLRDGARCKAVEHGFKGMGSATQWAWVYSPELAGGTN